MEKIYSFATLDILRHDTTSQKKPTEVFLWFSGLVQLLLPLSHSAWPFLVFDVSATNETCYQLG
jgi:hypothetical protein